MAREGRAHVRRLLAVVLVGVAGVGACASDATVGPESEPGVDPSVASFVDLMNDHRTSIGCPALTWSAEVAAVAQAHSADMVARDFFSHTNPDGDSPFDRLQDAGISYSAAAENIAYGYPTAEAVLDAWLGSAGHRANIENCSLTEHGVGLDGTHWTHLFIRP